MQTTLPLGSFFFVFTSHSFCVFELAVYSFTTVVCPVRHPFGYEYSTFTSVSCRVRFNILSIIITSLSLLLRCVCVRFDTLLIYHYFTFTTVCMSGSTPFGLSLLHFYYGVCPVRHPFDYHYFTFTRVCVSGSTPFRLSLFHYY
jgi:hypothetical protein